MTEFDAATCANCIRILLNGMAETQRDHAAAFLMAEVERLYLAAGVAPPPWIGQLRRHADWSAPTPPPHSS